VAARIIDARRSEERKAPASGDRANLAFKGEEENRQGRAEARQQA
jgi:hypothetical protein